MGKSYIGILLLSLLIGVQSCKTNVNPEEAEKKEQYFQAIDGYKKRFSKTRDKATKAKLAYKIAELQAKNSDYAAADIWYAKAEALGYSDVALHYQWGEVKKMNERYGDALKQYEIYAKEVPGDKRIDEQKKLISDAIDWKDSMRTRFVVENFKPANSAQGDWSPFLKKDMLYFTSDREGTTGTKTFGRTGLRFSDIYVMERKYSKDKKTIKWSSPSVVSGDINTMMNEGTPYLDTKGGTMYYTQCNGAKGDSIRNCVVMTADNKGKGWSQGQVLPFCVDTSVDYGHPAISPDGQRLIISCDMPGGKGGHDLYLSTYVKRSRTWSDLINLGDIINTEGDEEFPFWLNDTTLYFSSNGHIGMGGLDIYVTHGKNPGWSKPKNLKYPINSGGDDFGITFDEGLESGFFTSNRIHSQRDDIYAFFITPLMFDLKGVVYNDLTGYPEAKATVTLEGSNGTKLKTETNDSGKYSFKLYKDEDYEVRAKKKNFYNSKSTYLTTKGYELSQHFKRDHRIRPMKGPEIALDTKYDLDKANIRDDAKPKLDSLVGLLNEYPYTVIELSSHTDCRSSYAYNDTLSQRRADSAVAYLIKKGIDKDRLVAKGYGERMLVNNCACEDGKGPGMDCSEEEHQKNRRTTFKVLRSDYIPRKR